MPRVWSLIPLALLLLAGTPAPAGDVRDLEAVLAEMHPDYRRYIDGVRPFPEGIDPRNVHMGLVRSGGSDPRRRDDAPRPRAAEGYDLLIGPDAGTGSAAWTRLLLDHEYFHARHLARADRLPAPSFADAGATRHFHEALAWGHNLERARAGAYGTLPQPRMREAEERYRAHRQAVRQYVLRRQPAAWAYYGRYLPDRQGISSAGMR